MEGEGLNSRRPGRSNPHYRYQYKSWIMSWETQVLISDTFKGSG